MTRNPTSSKHFGVVAPVALVGIALFGWFAGRRTALSDEHMYESIRIGMSRADVEKLLGRPADETMGSRVYYGGTPKIEEWQSPASSHSVSIDYSVANIVKAKHYYPGNNVSHHEP